MQHLSNRRRPRRAQVHRDHQAVRVQQQLPNETASQAFTRIFTEDSAQGAAIRKFWQISKQGIAAGALDEPSEDDNDDESALDELNDLAAEVTPLQSKSDEGTGVHKSIHRSRECEAGAARASSQHQAEVNSSNWRREFQATRE